MMPIPTKFFLGAFLYLSIITAPVTASPAIEADGTGMTIKLGHATDQLQVQYGDNTSTKQQIVTASMYQTLSTALSQTTAQLSTLTSAVGALQGNLSVLQNTTVALDGSLGDTVASVRASFVSHAQLQGNLSSLRSGIDAALAPLRANISTAHDELVRLERASAASCEALCDHGTCGSSSPYTCTCDAGYFGAMCTQAHAPSAAPTRTPTPAPTTGGINSCNEVSTSGTYRFRGNFSAYCLIADGAHWMKISHWDQYYTQTTEAVNPALCAAATTSPSVFCKLSDAQINSVIPASSQDRYYRLNTTEYPQKMYLYTSQVYNDVQTSFGVNARQTRGMVTTQFSAAVRGATTFSQNWIDFLHVTDTTWSQGQGCLRYFIGHGANDCWDTVCSCRCIRAGAGCARYALASQLDPSQRLLCGVRCVSPCVPPEARCACPPFALRSAMCLMTAT
eukprot:m.410596 g.410596  ORF g.410596 m.410596 type:complete len:450 (+) comp21246_c1_seq50:153-1502(+)